MSQYQKVTLAAAALLMLTAFCGCRSDIYYQNRAVEQARSFLLKEAKELDLYQQEFVRYADPVILHSHILGKVSYGTPDILGSEQRQICVTWQMPDQKGVYMVYGVSGGRMANWKPERLIRKTFVKPETPLAAAAAQAVNYAVSNLAGDLSKTELNILRFSAPALLMTNFEAALKLPDDPEARTAALEAAAKKIQLTLAWNIGSDRCVYFCGRGLPNMGQWEIERVGIISRSELESRTLRTVLTKEQFYEKLPDLAAKKESAGKTAAK